MSGTTPEVVHGLGCLFLALQGAGCVVIGDPCDVSVWLGLAWHASLILTWSWWVPTTWGPR